MNRRFAELRSWAAALLLSLFLAVGIPALANNPQEAGAGCMEPSDSAQLGTVEDQLSQRSFVAVGVQENSPRLAALNQLA